MLFCSMEDKAKEILGRIVERRKQLKITQDEIATQLGMSNSNYRRIEYGDRELRLTVLLQIAEALQTDVTYFLKGEATELSLLAVDEKDMAAFLAAMLRSQKNLEEGMSDMRGKMDDMNDKLDKLSGEGE